jgi:hypothetical protein
LVVANVFLTHDGRKNQPDQRLRQKVAGRREEAHTHYGQRNSAMLDKISVQCYSWYGKGNGHRSLGLVRELERGELTCPLVSIPSELSLAQLPNFKRVYHLYLYKNDPL